METKDIFNKEVLDSRGNVIGKIYDIMFDMPQAKITHIMVRSGGLMGKKHTITTDQIASIGDKVILSSPWESPVGAGKTGGEGHA